MPEMRIVIHGQVRCLDGSQRCSHQEVTSQTATNKSLALENRLYSRQEFACRIRLDDVALGTCF